MPTTKTVPPQDARVVPVFSGATSVNDIAAETFPRWGATTAGAVVAGIPFVVRIHLKPGTYSNVTLYVTTQGVTNTNAFVGLYDSTTLAKLAGSASDIGVAMCAVAGNAAFTTALSYTVTVEADYYLVILVGTTTGTPVAFARANVVGSALGSVVTPIVFAKHGTGGLTALPDPLSGLTSASSLYYWARYS